MSNTNIHILTKNEYKMTRCQDGIILLFPIEGQLKLDTLLKPLTSKMTFTLLIIQIFFNSKNKTIMLYIASDWFRDRHFDFFNYKYSTNLVKSINSIKRALLQLVLNHLNADSVSEDTTYITSVVDIIGKEGAIEKSIANHQYNFSFTVN